MWKGINRPCGRTARWLDQYIDGALSLPRRRSVESHLRHCERCRHELEATRRTIGLLSDLPKRELSANFEAGLRARLASAPTRRSSRYLNAPWPSPYRRLMPAGALAAAALGVVAWRMELVPPQASPQPAPAYVAALVQEHQVLRTNADLSSTVVSHNLVAADLGDSEDE
jgi:anti-sigma factor RsiW